MVHTHRGYRCSHSQFPPLSGCLLLGQRCPSPGPRAPGRSLLLDVLDGIRRCAGPPQGAVVITIVFLHSVPQGLFQTNTTTAKSILSFWEIGCSPPEIHREEVYCVCIERSGGVSPGAKLRVNHADECRVCSSSRR